MQLTRFNAYCPLEVGDRILDTAGQVHTITDIACIHYVRGGNVEFRFELDHSGYYAPITAQDPSAKEQAASPAAEVGPTTPVPTSTVNGLPPEFVKFIKTRFG